VREHPVVRKHGPRLDIAARPQVSAAREAVRGAPFVAVSGVGVAVSGAPFVAVSGVGVAVSGAGIIALRLGVAALRLGVADAASLVAVTVPPVTVPAVEVVRGRGVAAVTVRHSGIGRRGHGPLGLVPVTGGRPLRGVAEVILLAVPV
jgi:hypothetical protein